MDYCRNGFIPICCIFVIILHQGICSNSNDLKLRSKRDYEHWYLTNYNKNNPPPLPPNGSYFTNKLSLPEKAIYCTNSVFKSGRYTFLQKYFAHQRKHEYYTSNLECMYPRSVEFPELGDEIPTTPKPKLTGVQKFHEALMVDSNNFREFLNKVDKGETPKPYKSMDVDALTDDIMNDIFHHKPDPLDVVDAASPNGIICERLKFNENDIQGLPIEIERPICYPAPRPPPPPSTTPIPSSSAASSEIYDTACYVLCHAGAIYQLLPCCRS